MSRCQRYATIIGYQAEPLIERSPGLLHPLTARTRDENDLLLEKSHHGPGKGGMLKGVVIIDR